MSSFLSMCADSPPVRHGASCRSAISSGWPVQNELKYVPRWSVGYSRHSSSRAISWLSPTRYASMNRLLVSSSVAMSGRLISPSPGIIHSRS